MLSTNQAFPIPVPKQKIHKFRVFKGRVLKVETMAAAPAIGGAKVRDRPTANGLDVPGKIAFQVPVGHDRQSF